MSEMPPSLGRRPDCRYPQSHPTARTIQAEIAAIAENRRRCTSFYLDTVEGMSNDGILSREGDDHHQGLARSHKLSDGSIYFFLSHSELDEGDQGSLSCYRYAGPTDNEHVLDTQPLTVAPMRQIVMLDERHPSDIVFLPDVNGLDAGYVFVTLEFDRHVVACYRWNPAAGLVFQGLVPQGLPADGPNFLFVDRVDNVFYLGIASFHWGWGQLLSARDRDLFPGCTEGSMDVLAFRPVGMFPFPVRGASQTKLIRDSEGDWYLLGYRSDPEGDEHGDDYVDGYRVRFSAFCITPLLFSVHIFFRPGDTGFASTGTHYVEPSGRLLISSSYRWAEDEGPADSSYVSRVDECPSS
jgi:hypothetical protein